MAKNLAATVTLILTVMALSALVIFHTCQVQHLEELVIANRNEAADLQRSVNRLYGLVESGNFRGGTSTGTGWSDVPADLPPAVAAQRRYYSDAEWAALLAPGNLVSPRLVPFHVEGTDEGGTLNRAFIVDIPGLNPITKNAADVSELYTYITRALARRDRSDPDRYAAELAYRVEANADFTEYHVWLREGVKWHPPAVDFNDPRYEWLRGDHYVTADDFAFTFATIQNPGVEAAHLRNYLEDLDHIEVINDHEFIVRWKQPYQASIEVTLTMEPIPRFIYAFDEEGRAFNEDEFAARFNEHWYNSRAIGCGPYRFVRYEPARVVELERWNEYYDELPPIERLVFRIAADPNTRLNELLSGGIDFMAVLPTQYEQAVIARGQPAFLDGTIEHEIYQGTSYRYLGWNADRPLFSDRRVRRAMTHALNRQRMITEIFHGLGREITGPFFIDGPYYNHDVVPYAFDLQMAADLLTQAGWVDSDNDGVRDKVVDGNRMNFEFSMLTYGYRPEFMASMEIYRNDLASIGVRMNIEGVEWPIMTERMEEKDFDAFTGGWVLGWDIDPYQIFHSSQADVVNGSNRVGFRNREADEIIETARRTFALEERIPLFHRFHEIMHEEQPFTFFFAPREVGAWRSRLDNVSFAPLRPFDLSFAWYISDAQ